MDSIETVGIIIVAILGLIIIPSPLYGWLIYGTKTESFKKKEDMQSIKKSRSEILQCPSMRKRCSGSEKEGVCCGNYGSPEGSTKCPQQKCGEEVCNNTFVAVGGKKHMQCVWNGNSCVRGNACNLNF